MKRFDRLKGLAILGMLLFLFSAAMATQEKTPRMEHNAFLRKPVFSTSGLTEEVAKDPVVLRRYEKHFMTGKDGLVKYMKKLRLKPLPETRKFYVYNVDGKLVIRKRLLTVRRGTLVFVDEKGKPILKRSCGNPMATYIPAKGETSNEFSPIKSVDGETDLVPVPEPDTLVEPAVPIAAAIEPTVEPVNPTVVEQPVDLMPTPAPTPVLPAFPTAGVPLWPLLAIPIIPIIVNPPHGSDPVQGVAPVPEPSGFLALGVAGLGLASRRKIRRGR